ncbi:MAG: SCO family protein [Alphaproteobacteria bacterium]|nr:SCO family protein [Alphaproteobacteria bacterium]
MSPANRGLLVFLLVLAVLIAGFGYENGWFGDGPPPGLPLGGPFSLTDQNGATRTDVDFRGKLMLIYFGYTNCPDTCPATLTEIIKALDVLGPAGAGVEPIFITVDPARDTPARLKTYAANFSPRLIALTGTPAQLAAVEREFRVYASKEPGGPVDDALLDHSSFIYLMGRDGKLARVIPPGEKPADLADDIRKYL